MLHTMEMNRRRAATQAYLAGILDGEGSFGIYEAGGCWQGRVVVSMQDPEAVLLLLTHYPDGRLSVRSLPEAHTEFRVVYSHFRGYDLIREIRPFLLVKNRQARILLSFLVHRRRLHEKKAGNGHGLACERCRDLVEALRSVRRENKGVKTVNLLLEHGMREYRAKRADVEHLVTQMVSLLEGVETRDRASMPVEPMSAPEQEIVQLPLA